MGSNNNDPRKLFGQVQERRAGSQMQANQLDPHHRAAARLEMIQALERGQIAAVDRFNTKIEKGSLVMWRTPYDLIFQVADIEPVAVTPQGPLLRVHMQVTVPADLIANMPNMGLTVCGKLDVTGKHGALGVPEAGTGAPVIVGPDSAPPVIDPPDLPMPTTTTEDDNGN